MSNDAYPTQYTDNQAPLVSAGWLNDVGAAVWGAIGTGRAGTPPTTPAQVRANLGIVGPQSPLSYGADTGAVNVLVLTLATPPTAYADGQVYLVKVANTNTGNSTLNVNSLGAKNIYDLYGARLVAGFLVAGNTYEFVYNTSLNSAAGGFQVQAVEPIVSLFNFLTAAQVADVLANTLLVDCAPNIQNAFNSGASAVYTPPFQYKCSSGVQFNGISVFSFGFQPTNPPSGARFVFDLSVATCVTMGGSAATNQSTTLKGISILRAAGSPPAGSIGLLNQNTNASIIEDVMSVSHQIPWKLQNDRNAYGITGYFNRVYTGAAYDTHLLVDSWTEARFNQCRFGMNGSGDQNCNSYVRIIGGSSTNAGDGPNTLSWVSCQFNQGVNTGTNWISFQNQIAANLVPFNIFQFDTCYVEDDVAGIVSDATVTSLTYIMICNTLFIPTTSTKPLFSLNAVTGLIDCEITNSIIGCALTLTGATTQITRLAITGTTFKGAVSLTGGNSSTANMIGNYYQNGLTLAGAWANLNAIGGMLVGGALSNTATGSVKVDISPNNALITTTCTITFGGAAVGVTYSLNSLGYQVHGSRVTADFQITLTNKGSSVGFLAINYVGLPAINGGAFAAGAGGMINYSANLAALTAAPMMLAFGGGTSMNVYQQTAGGVGTVTDGNLTNTTQLHGSFSYFM